MTRVAQRTGTVKAVRDIAEVLNRRADLSTFLVHLTRRDEERGTTAIDNLASILSDGCIQARSAYGFAKNVARAGDTQKVVCFSETPLEHINSLFDIAGRQINMEPYGLVFTKVVARQKGALPVWYVQKGSAQEQALDELRMDAWTKGEDDWPTHPGAKLFPFVELMGTAPGYRKEFWWEREWRHAGDFCFRRRADLAIVVAPEKQHERLRARFAGLRAVIDPDWSLERVIASLVGLDPATVTPFTP
jgi:hypothetical protein